ncbi:hypothetical protein Tco_1376621 [Tanacetum coccineum]
MANKKIVGLENEFAQFRTETNERFAAMQYESKAMQEDNTKRFDEVMKALAALSPKIQPENEKKNTADVTQDQLMLLVFPITLTGAPTSTRNKGSNTFDGLAAIQAQLNNVGRKIKKVNERVYAAQVGCELCNGPHYTKDCPLNEEGKTLEEVYYTQFRVPFPQAGRYRAAALGFYQRKNLESSTGCLQSENQELIKALEIQIGQMSKVLQEMGYESLPSSTETNLRDHVKSITTTNEAETLKEDDKRPLIELNRATIPFPSRLK